MENSSIDVNYNQSEGALVDVLDKLERPGCFAVSGSHETPMPLLEIDGAGVISFPVPASQVESLIHSAAERAPYGRGSETLVDESVRKVWQIAPERIQLSGNGWTKGFPDLISRAAEGLGCVPADVSTEFYKLLVYDTGGFFLAHRDSEKTKGMFGTLVVTLPSAHAGGLLMVRHAGREEKFDLCGTDPGEVRYAAFYADCEHEVQPITDGYRICLVFNLIHAPKTEAGAPLVPDNRNAVNSAASILRTWSEKPSPEKLVYLLDHHYTPSGLSFAGLKNADAARADALRKACALANCELHLAIVHIEDSGSAEDSGGYGRRSRWRGDDEDDESEDFSIGEVCESDQYLGEFRNSADIPVSFRKVPLGEDELLPAGALDDEDPDDVHFSEATGNAGAEFERTYLRAALVLWPQSRANAVCLSAGVGAAVARLGGLVDRLSASSPDLRDSARADVTQLAGLIFRNWKADHESADVLADLLRHLVASGDGKLLQACLSLPAVESYTGVQTPQIVAALSSLDAVTASDLLVRMMAAHMGDKPGACMDLWVSLAKGSRFDASSLAAGAREIATQFAQCEAGGAQRHQYWVATESVQKITADLVFDFLSLVTQFKLESELSLSTEGMLTNPGVFPPDTILVPLLEMTALRTGDRRTTPATLSAIWKHSAEHYLARSGQPPTPPANWALPVTFSDTTRDGQALIAFAEDPEAKEKRFPLAKNRRQYLHQLIDRHSLDMTHITERLGRPYTLVCVKNRATYIKCCRRYEADLVFMRRLRTLANSGFADDVALVERLDVAIENKKQYAGIPAD